MGDFNAHHNNWSMGKQNERGTIFKELIEENNFDIVNFGKKTKLGWC